LAQGLPAVRLANLSAVFMAEWRAVLGKNRCCEEKCKPIIIRGADGAPWVNPPLVGKPVAPLSFADSLHERRDLVARHPDLNTVHKKSGQSLSFRISWNTH